MTSTTAIGLMSGTSMDGVDVALIETDGENAIALRGTASFPMRDEDRALLREAIADAARLSDRRARPGALAAGGDYGHLPPRRGGGGVYRGEKSRRAKQSISSAFTARPCCTGRSAA